MKRITDHVWRLGITRLARCLGLFDFRILQQYLTVADMATGIFSISPKPSAGRSSSRPPNLDCGS